MQGATANLQALGLSQQFQSTPPMQGATPVRPFQADWIPVFQSTPPMQGATVVLDRAVSDAVCFNPRPLCRERRTDDILKKYTKAFQSTPPMQGATLSPSPKPSRKPCFNPRPLCRERPTAGMTAYKAQKSFNPRPLCRERRSRHKLDPVPAKVSIHAPYAGSDYIDYMDRDDATRFQSTPPMQGATASESLWLSILTGFNPRPLCRERLLSCLQTK